MHTYTEYKGRVIPSESRIAIVVSRFNALVTRSLLQGALETLERHGIPSNQIMIVWVPGAYELPLAAKRVATANECDAIICLGALIRGATPHFDYIASQVSSMLAQVSLETGIPIIFGVLTTDTAEQALERAGIKGGNKGSDAAQTALEMIDLFQQLSLSTPLSRLAEG